MSEGSDVQRDSSETSGEQRKLSEEVPDEPARTIQERVLTLYNSSNLLEVAIGFWLKLFFEAVVVALPLILLFLFPTWILSWLNLVPVTYFEGATIWLSLSTTILLAVWCFSEPATSSEEVR